MAKKIKNLKGQLYYDFLYIRDKAEFDSKDLEKKLKSRALKSYRKKTIKSGPLKEVEIYPIWDTKTVGRAKRSLESSDKQKKQNDKNRRKHINRLIHINFKEGDLWVTLGYGAGNEPKDLDEAYKHMTNYIRCLSRVAKKEGKDFKYIYVTERSSKGRIHHHLICNFNDREMVEKKWKFGKYPNARRIKTQDGTLEGLANYICKEVRELKNTKSYKTSKNLKQPTITISDTGIKKGTVSRLAFNENALEEFAIKEYDGMRFISSEVKFSDYCDGAYIYLKMIRR